MRFAIAVLIGRVVRFAGRFLHRSTNLPGQVALKICPDLLGRLTFQGKVIAVTGSNGKTTTSNLIAHILRQNGYSVVNNTEGSNLTAGVATTLLCSCTLGGHVAADFVVLEVDERYSRLIFKEMKLDYFLINNLLRDQVVRNGNPDIVLDKIAQAIHPGVKLILNANDPISQTISPETPRAYFGMARTGRSTDTCVNLTQDCKVCPYCFHTMQYEYFHYNHIGKFACSHCDYHMPQPDYLATDVNFETGDFCINGHPAKVTYTTVFHFMNTTAAVAVACEAGLKLEDAIAAAATFEVSRERYDEFDVGGRKAVLMLTKQNPVSLDQSISFVLTRPEEKTVVLFVNNVIYTENKDISWLYDVAFERLKGQADYIVCSGSRAYDIAVRLKLGGFEDSVLKVEDDLKKLRGVMESTTGTIYILAASAFGDEDGILDVLRPQK